MKATAKTTQRPGTRQQRAQPTGPRHRGAGQPKAPRARTRLIAFLAAAGTLFAAAPLWPGPSSRVTWASGLFLAAVGVVTYLVATTAATTYGSGDGAASARNAVLLVLLVVVPLFLDLRVIDSYNLPKLTVTLIGALAIAAVWVAAGVRPASRPLWRNGLHWPVLALLGWTAITTATSVSPRMSTLGALGTNDGLLAAAAFTVIFFAMSQTITVEHVKAMLSVLYFGAGGLTVLYGVIQLHDRLYSGPAWDWLRHVEGAGTAGFANSGIFSTFGNPNFLGGFLAVLVPIGLALLVLHGSRRRRIVTAVIMIGLLVEVLQTASRGALLAAVVSVAIAGALLRSDIRRAAMSLRPVVAVTASVLVAALTLAGVSQSSVKFSSVLDVDATLSIRTEIWETGLAMANGRPLLGHGPDTWTDRVWKYRDAERHGPGLFSNSAHNVFIGQLASTGYPGLMLLLALLGFGAIRTVGTWRRLRQIEALSTEDEVSRAHSARMLLAGVGGGLVAYLIQACFNVSQVGLSFTFWVLLGLLCALSLAAAVPVTLRPREVLGRPQEPNPSLVESDARAHGRPGGRKAGGDTDVATGAIAVLVFIALLLGIFLASRPYRADHNEWAARLDTSSAVSKSPEQAQRLSRRAAARRSNAVNLNPWEPTYLLHTADDFFIAALARPNRSPAQITALRRAREHYERAIALRPHTVPYLLRYADVLLKLHEVDSTTSDARSGAIRALRRAVSSDPTSTDARERLQLLLES